MIPTRNTRPIAVLWPWQTAKLCLLTTSYHVLITAGTRIITCVSRVLYVLTMCAIRACPRSNVLRSSIFIPRPTPFRSFPTSCHVYNAAVARLQREQHRLFHVRLLFDVFWPWLSRQVLSDQGLSWKKDIYSLIWRGGVWCPLPKHAKTE